VSTSGTDSGGCNTPTAACASLSFAHNHTVAGGAINCVSPNVGFSNTTITTAHAITIDCRDANFLLEGSLTDAITVNAGPNDDVTLRGLRFHGAGGIELPDLTGVKFNSGGSLHIEDCTFTNFSTTGVSIATNTMSKAFIADTKIKANGSGVVIKTRAQSSRLAEFGDRQRQAIIRRQRSALPLSMPVAKPNSARFVACPDRCIATDDAAAPAHTLLSAARQGAIRGSGSAWIAV
jgi:hypothetical protein